MTKQQLDEMRKQQKEMEEQVRNAERKLYDTEREARKYLVAKYRIETISRIPAIKLWMSKQRERLIKQGVQYTYQFKLVLDNKDEFDAHFEKYGITINPPDEEKISVRYFWMPVGVTNQGNMGVIGHEGGGHYFLHDYMPITQEEWWDLIEGNITRWYTDTFIIKNDNINFVYHD